MTNKANDAPTPDPERYERLFDFMRFARVHNDLGLTAEAFARILEYAHTCEVPVSDEQLAGWFGMSVPLVKGWRKSKLLPSWRTRRYVVHFLIVEALLEADTIQMRWEERHVAIPWSKG